jgi:hypothetical protein
MARNPNFEKLWPAGFYLFTCMLLGLTQAEAQVRGLYPLGISATNSGVTPEPGFSFSSYLAIYTRNKFKGPNGEVTATGRQSVVMDLNTLAWVSKKQILGGAHFSMMASIPVANNSLTNDLTGPISRGSGLADSFYQPFVLGWNKKRFAIRTTYGFLAPTGSYKLGASDNVGSGYWTHIVSSGQTFFLTKNKATTLSTFQMYEWHTTQKGTNIHPGQTMNLDYSLMQAMPIRKSISLQVGLVGYNTWQTTDKTGPTITPEQSKAYYQANSLGFATNLTLPAKVNVGFKYFREFGNRNTFQGYSVQAVAGIRF